MNPIIEALVTILTLIGGVLVIFKYVAYADKTHKQDYQARREELGNDELLESSSNRVGQMQSNASQSPRDPGSKHDDTILPYL